VPEARRTCRDACSHLIEHNGEDLRNRSFLDRKAALARLLRLLNEHIADGGPTVFAHPCRLGAEASSQSGSTAPIDPELRNPAAIAVQREGSGNWKR